MDKSEIERFLAIEGLCTDTQRSNLEALIEHGSIRKAAKSLGRHKSTLEECIKMLRQKASRLGHAPGHFEHGVAPGYLMGKVTVQRSGDGNVERTWERQSPDQARMLDALKAVVEGVCEDAKGALPPTDPPKHYDKDLLTVIPLGDPHFGLMTWAKEVGENFDLKIAEQITFDAVDRLCAKTPSSGTALLLNLGDYFHADNSTNRTPRSGANLDVDGRFQHIIQVGFRAMVRCIRRMLEHHEKVIVRNNPGNHDPHQAFTLSLALSAMFHDEPRIQIDMSPSGFYYYRFGNTLIGSTHGDGAKLPDLGAIMANDVPHEWAAALWRVWHCGHFHHDQVKDFIGCTVETHRTLAANDAWHRYAGYRSVRGCKAIVYHRESGEEFRIPLKVRRFD